MTIFADQFRTELANILSIGQGCGFVAVEVNSGKLHRRVGAYPGRGHRMPLCCDVMRQAMRIGDTVVNEPPSGQGASLTIRYRLPRKG